MVFSLIYIWVKKWEIEGSNGHIWIVAVDKDGNYGCSCPVWKFKRQECHHIIQIKSNQEQGVVITTKNGEGLK